MRIVRLVLLILLMAVVVVAVGGFVVYEDTMRGPLPQTSGTLTVDGLHAQVEVLRDDWGIPHIYGSDLHDIFFAQGFVQAQDRWWQMEFYRHVGSGTIGELTAKNDSAFGNDVYIRTAGWRRTAEQETARLTEPSKLALQAFADGVNAYILHRSADDLAMEYRLLGVTGVSITIKPWTIVDTIVWGKVMSWNLTDSSDYEYIRSEVIDTLGQAMMEDFTPPFPYDSDRPTTLYAEDLPITDDSASAPTVDVAAGKIMNPTMAGGVRIGDFAYSGDIGTGSNNWVATGSMTQNGTPLLANDPHLGIQMPSIWYEVGLHCLPVTDLCPLNVVGFAFPPAPGVIIGHNDFIAWGVTNLGADVLDLYHIKVNPDDPLQYEWNGAWRDMTLVTETITFGDGEAPVTIQVRQTHMGPIINDNQIDEETGEVRGYSDDPLVLRWTAGEPGTLYNALVELDTASDWEQFRAALRDWDAPSQNFVYADVQGNIGYQMPGSMPIRPAGKDGQTPTLVTGDADDWQGYVPFDDLPRIFNPARDYIVTANQAVVPMQYYDQLADKFDADNNYLYSYDWAYGERALRITELLQENAPNTVETYQRIQSDNKNVNAQLIVPYLNDLQIPPGSVAE
ncbi:MAG: penicillin acylase family protein, partial [Anaerolineae bacterium]|nr:penicillin acylase family protein [Anaerolineae bacterium]